MCYIYITIYTYNQENNRDHQHIDLAAAHVATIEHHMSEIRSCHKEGTLFS